MNVLLRQLIVTISDCQAVLEERVRDVFAIDPLLHPPP